jgi:hypothetical protein
MAAFRRQVRPLGGGSRESSVPASGQLPREMSDRRLLALYDLREKAIGYGEEVGRIFLAGIVA